MIKIKKLLFFIIALILFWSFTSSAYAIPFGGAGRHLLKGLKNAGDDVIENIFGQSRKASPRNIGKKLFENIGQETKHIGQKQKKIVYDPLEGIGPKLENLASKSKNKRIIKNVSYFTAGGLTVAMNNYISNLSNEKQEEIKNWGIDPRDILKGLVKITSSDGDDFGGGFFLDNNNIITSHHIINNSKNNSKNQIKNLIICNEAHLGKDHLTFKKYILGPNEKECANGFIEIKESKKNNKKNCFSKGGHKSEENVFECSDGFISKDEESFEIKLIDGSKMFGNLVASDKDLDLAIIRVNPFFYPGYLFEYENINKEVSKNKRSLKFHVNLIQFNLKAPLTKNLVVFAVGHPILNIEGKRIQKDNIWTQGKIIDFTNKKIEKVPYNNSKIDYILTSAEVHKGNSGGPLLYNGKVIGLIQKKIHNELLKNNKDIKITLLETGSLATHFNKLNKFILDAKYSKDFKPRILNERERIKRRRELWKD